MPWHAPLIEFAKVHFTAAIDIHMTHGVVKLAVSKVSPGPAREVAEFRPV